MKFRGRKSDKRQKEMFRYRHSTMKDSIHTRGCLNRVNNEVHGKANGNLDQLLVLDHSGHIVPTGDVGAARSKPKKASEVEAETNTKEEATTAIGVTAESEAEATGDVATEEGQDVALQRSEEEPSPVGEEKKVNEDDTGVATIPGLELEPDPTENSQHNENVILSPLSTDTADRNDQQSSPNEGEEEKKEEGKRVTISDDANDKDRPSLNRPCSSALYKMGCSRRLSCPKIESRRSITFGTVTIRDYEMTLGDHPDCSYGPPVQLGWNYLEYCPLELNEYEMHHSLRRPLKDLVLNYYQRRDLLRGFDEQTLKAAVKEVKRTQMKRSVTRATLPVRRVEDVAESARRKMGRILMKRRDEDELGAWCKGDDSVATASTADTALEVEGNPISVQ
uniref:Uncharacterized protein n=1 Tax=Trieres chinensis TaxID=1514140 RepID=A0A7S1ZLI9_TRICV|mmetsp:Transcript_28309/g.57878  ORF Transcript_28309/g.57878 Transcript_28309/m.57878 type:complete len:393 (+) Transcript_28309:168-1346(+)